MSSNKYLELRSINVSEKIEKKANLSYLSWSWAVDTLLQHDPSATWEYQPHMMFGDTMMVFCSVTAFSKTMTAQLPVMDNRNKAIGNPDAMDVNKAMQRCLAKAIALHGIGLYIYAGEDLPEVQPEPEPVFDDEKYHQYLNAIEEAPEFEALKQAYAGAWKYLKQFGMTVEQDLLKAVYEENKTRLGAA